MARIETDPNYTSPTFSRATAATDLFKKEDVQQVAAALSTHTHGTGKGLAIDPSGIAAGAIPGSAIADGAITSAKIADGTIATGDLANNAVTNAKLGTDTARLNLLSNGGFEIWQRGNGPFTVNFLYAADRWSLGIGSGSSLSVSKDTTNIDTGSVACAALTYTHSALSYIVQKVEPTELRGRTVSASVRVRTAAANAVFIQIADGVGAGASSAIAAGSGTYQTLTATYAVAPTATYVQLGIFLQASGTFYVDNAMLVVGNVAPDYAPLHPADDLHRCLRYYELIGDAYPYPIIAGYGATGAGVYVNVPFTARKALSPTITKNGTWSVNNCGQPSNFGSTTIGSVLSVIITTTGSCNAQPGGAGQNITVEANP